MMSNTAIFSRHGFEKIESSAHAGGAQYYAALAKSQLDRIEPNDTTQTEVLCEMFDWMVGQYPAAYEVSSGEATS